MSWCPYCKSEYEDSKIQCEDCGASLIMKLDDNLLEDEVEIDELFFGVSSKLLYSFKNEWEADVFTGILKKNDIPSFITSRKGIILLDDNIPKVDVFVPEKLFSIAHAILCAFTNIKKEEKEYYIDSDLTYENKSFIGIISIVVILAFLFLIIYFNLGRSI